MSEEVRLFTQEQFKKYLRFLTKTKVEERLGDLRNEPDSSDQKSNTNYPNDEKIDPEKSKEAEGVLKSADKVTKTYEFIGTDFEKFGLGKIKNCTVEHIKEFRIISTQNIKEVKGSVKIVKESVELRYKHLPLDYFEVNHQEKKAKLLSTDIQTEGDQLDLFELEKENEVIRLKITVNQPLRLKEKGLITKEKTFNQPAKYYEGQCSDRKPDGQGLLKLQKHAELTGIFAEGKLNDLNGRIQFEEGSLYEGNVVDSKPHGKGRMTMLRTFNRIYEGKYNKGRMNGLGETTFDNGDVLSSQMKDDLVDGYGELKRSNGVKYSGMIKQDKHFGFVF